MASSPSSSQTLPGSTPPSSPPPEHQEPLNLSILPPIFVSSTHLDTEVLHDLEEDLVETGAILTWDVNEAKIILSKVESKRRAQFDLRSKGLWTEEYHSVKETCSRPNHQAAAGPAAKRCRIDVVETSRKDDGKAITIDGSETESEAEEDPRSKGNLSRLQIRSNNQERSRAPLLTKSLGILSRGHGGRTYGAPTPGITGASFDRGRGGGGQYAHLLQQTTSEYDEGISSELPEMPDWVKNHVKYACQRRTPANSPNDDFIALLKKIKLARLLTNDQIGVRAYSTSIASIAAYPSKLSNPREILALPGCDVKVANLFVEFANTGKIQAAEDAENNVELKVLRLFYEIWGVGATTAREFFYDRGWRDLDDIVEYGWSTLQRVQQIGVKYYEEFLSPIPRSEVEEIARVVHSHAVRVRDDRIQSLVVGGYRRGKQSCGDVDIIISHPEEDQTLNLVTDIVASLETEGWVTHTLLLTLTSSQRDQQTLPFKTSNAHPGHGFDTLDKALVVWQDPSWPTEDADLAANPRAKNPNVHRRVDIIISPWRTVGCAVAGWTSGTTFQRDLRRYCKHTKGWKFDSSGVRERMRGQWVDLEAWEKGKEGRAKTMVEAEKRVFEGLGLEYFEPEDRCTG
ncbi:hypothetical protein H2203_005482 [Taxawa tesnikishii (nom. ined.)]|nr:hypothetical protein H2203_005482 [Dothideales sp. JES 119]